LGQIAVAGEQLMATDAKIIDYRITIWILGDHGPAKLKPNANESVGRATALWRSEADEVT